MTSRFPEQFWIPGEKPVQSVAIEGMLPKESSQPSLTDREQATVEPRAFVESSLAEIPWSVFLPDPYEASYPYPLLIWLHGSGSDEEQIQKIVPQISDRNVIGVGLRGDLSWKTSGVRHYGWRNTPESTDRFACRLYPTIRQLRRLLHVHTERVFLGGIDDGAMMAMSLLLRYPRWFAGAALLNSGLPETPRPLSEFRELTGKRVFFGTTTDTSARLRQHVAQSARLLYTAGLEVKQFRSLDNGMPADWLRGIDHWILESSPGTTIIS